MKFKSLEEIAKFLSEKELDPIDLDIFIDETDGTDEDNNGILSEQLEVADETTDKRAVIEWGISSVEYALRESEAPVQSETNIGPVTGEIHLSISKRAIPSTSRAIDINIVTEGNTSIVRIPIQKYGNEEYLTTAVAYDDEVHTHTLKIKEVDMSEETIIVYSSSN